MNTVAGEGKKARNFWASHPSRSPLFLGFGPSTLRGPGISVGLKRTALQWYWPEQVKRAGENRFGQSGSLGGREEGPPLGRGGEGANLGGRGRLSGEDRGGRIEGGLHWRLKGRGGLEEELCEGGGFAHPGFSPSFAKGHGPYLKWMVAEVQQGPAPPIREVSNQVSLAHVAEQVRNAATQSTSAAAAQPHAGVSCCRRHCWRVRIVLEEDNPHARTLLDVLRAKAQATFFPFSRQD